MRVDECDNLDADAATAAAQTLAAQADPPGYTPALKANDAARAATGVDGISAGAMLETGVVLVRRALAAWQSGDLAGAVNALDEWADEVESNFPALDYADDDESDD